MLVVTVAEVDEWPVVTRWLASRINCSFLTFLGGSVGEGAIRGEPERRGEEPLRCSVNPLKLGTGLDQRLPPAS